MLSSSLWHIFEKSHELPNLTFVCLLQPSVPADDSDLRFDNSCCYIPWFSLNKTRTVTGWFLFSLESWCLPRLRLGKHQDSRKNKTNCFPRDHTLSVECHAQTHPITAYYYRTKRRICFTLISNFPGMLPVCYDVIYSTQFSKYQTWALFWRLSTQGIANMDVISWRKPRISDDIP